MPIPTNSPIRTNPPPTNGGYNTGIIPLSSLPSYNQFQGQTIPGALPQYSNVSDYIRQLILNNQGQAGANIHSLYQNIDKWSPYINQQGNYTWANPSAYNPVPQANVPGAPLAPNTTYQNLAANTQAFQDLLPYIQGAINQQTLPTALTQLGASEATSPGYANLMTQLYAQFGPQLNAIGSGINTQNMGNYVAGQNQILGGVGNQLLQQGYNSSQIFDSPYYQARQQTADSLGNLLNSIDLSGNLSGSETNQIGQGLARQGVQTGTLNAPSNANIVSNAMQYGQAAYQRKQAAQSQMGSAINSASGFLPTSKSGVNVFDTGTGAVASSPTNMGNQLFTGINQNFGQNIGASLLGDTTQTGLGAMNDYNQYQINNANINANKKDWSDYLNQVSKSVSNIASVAGAAAGACWVAREVYNNGPEWIAFRHYLFTEAPSELFNTYLSKGEKIANAIKHDANMKLTIKQLMNKLI